ncbi:hypothetical protein STAQ_26810 [Allostella sp. ATCC 35155]|nr:hypothetical protein STAQ_26810 [Stella sp. ATCC 35155]
MERLGLAAHVDGMFHSAALGCRKPEPAFFTAIASALGRSPDEILLVDDLAENVHAAAAGWDTVHWTDCPAAWAALDARLAPWDRPA